jgi:epoxyqueuosine reductase
LPPTSLEQSIKEEARRLGFVLAGVTTPDAPEHLPVFAAWLNQRRHGSMAYLEREDSRSRRAHPRLLMADCRSILVLAVPYSKPEHWQITSNGEARGRVAAYAWGLDYHDVLPSRLQALVAFIELQVGRRVRSLCCTDSAPILERDLAQRAGIGWIGKNTCLINPKLGSYFLLAEILLDLELRPDPPWRTDHCGTCTRCLDACPTACILPDRTLDARRCISYLTIEERGTIPTELRALMGDWVFGCDICQVVCPWNRFAPRDGDPAFSGDEAAARPALLEQLSLSEAEFGARFAGRAITRPKHAGYMRNVAVAAGNTAGTKAIPALRTATQGSRAVVREHAEWALKRIAERLADDG